MIGVNKMSSNSFRRSFRGFNRKDVINYISVLSKRLEQSVSDYNKLKTKYDELAGKEVEDTQSLKTKIASLEEENAALKAENENLQKAPQDTSALPNHLL